MAGPYTQGDVALNVRRAIEAGNLLLEAGHIPYIPHLTHFWHLLFPRPYEDWIELDEHWVPLCHALLRLLGDSNGADKEVILARSLQMPIFYAGYPEARTGMKVDKDSIVFSSLERAIQAITDWQDTGKVEVKD